MVSSRTYVGAAAAQPDIDLTWQEDHCASGEQYVQVLREVCFHPTLYDQSLKAAARGNKAPEDWTDYEGPAAALKQTSLPSSVQSQRTPAAARHLCRLRLVLAARGLHR